MGVGNGFQDGKARAVDLDLSSRKGARPTSGSSARDGSRELGAPGSSDPTTSQSATSTHTDQITVKVGPLGGTAGGTTDQGQVIETVHADGTKVTTMFSRRGSTVLAHEFTKGQHAIVADKYALHLQERQQLRRRLPAALRARRRDRLQPRPHAQLQP